MWGKYTRFLEKENEELKQKVADLEAQLRLTDRIPQHTMKKGETRASCSCGWTCNADDPGVLQTAISGHYRESTVHRGRKSWPQVKAALEMSHSDR